MRKLSKTQRKQQREKLKQRRNRQNKKTAIQTIKPSDVVQPFGWSWLINEYGGWQKIVIYLIAWGFVALAAIWQKDDPIIMRLFIFSTIAGFLGGIFGRYFEVNQNSLFEKTDELRETLMLSGFFIFATVFVLLPFLLNAIVLLAATSKSWASSTGTVWQFIRFMVIFVGSIGISGFASFGMIFLGQAFSNPWIERTTHLNRKKRDGNE